MEYDWIDYGVILQGNYYEEENKNDYKSNNETRTGI